MCRCTHTCMCAYIKANTHPHPHAATHTHSQEHLGKSSVQSSNTFTVILLTIFNIKSNKNEEKYNTILYPHAILIVRKLGQAPSPRKG